ncbi:hypothetical protein THRCLA_22782 [Thraustotheca clavata]|uniref:Ankyrin repeat protein n=1 Tax=Thraustotheca clavata TaxID=74557 RepID=A0A1V9YTH9_9STRA|nr:hypothetical protein THRCLA_22782 [Thraustotheca clavata]
MDGAVRNGCTSRAMNQAAYCNRLDVIKFLRNNRAEGFPYTAIHHAAFTKSSNTFIRHAV